MPPDIRPRLISPLMEDLIRMSLVERAIFDLINNLPSGAASQVDLKAQLREQGWKLSRREISQTRKRLINKHLIPGD